MLFVSFDSDSLAHCQGALLFFAFPVCLASTPSRPNRQRRLQRHPRTEKTSAGPEGQPRQEQHRANRQYGIPFSPRRRQSYVERAPLYVVGGWFWTWKASAVSPEPIFSRDRSSLSLSTHDARSKARPRRVIAFLSSSPLRLLPRPSREAAARRCLPPRRLPLSAPCVTDENAPAFTRVVRRPFQCPLAQFLFMFLLLLSLTDLWDPKG